MKRVLKNILPVILALLAPLFAAASHIVGGDITYRCLGNNKYEILVNVYRDCFYGDPNAWFDNPASIGIFNQTNNLVMEVKIPLGGINDTLSSIITDPCLFDPGDVCVHTTRYKKTVTLPPIPGGYTLVYQRCCRNETISNIFDPFYTGATYLVKLTEEAMAECNTAPDFGGPAPLFICVNKPLVYDHSATEPDGDSLVYKLYTPFSGATFDDPQPVPPNNPPYDTVVWVSPFYSLENVLGGDSIPLQIDPHTGILTAFPTIQGQFVVGVLVEEYRDGQLISVVRRDFQYNVGQCGEIISSFFSPEAQCENLTVSFDNQSTLSDHFTWYFDWPNTDLTSSETDPVFTFPDTGWYTVALIAEPTSVCTDTFFREIYLQNNSLFVDFNLFLFDCADSSVVEIIDQSIDTVSPIVSWYWELTYNGVSIVSTEQNPVFLIPNPLTATIVGTLTSQNGCVQSVTRVFETGLNYPDELIPDLIPVCLGGSVNLNPNFQQIGNHPYSWSPGIGLDDPTSPNPTATPDQTTVYTVTIFANNNLCTVTKDVTVEVIPLPELSFESDIDCDGVTVNFTNTSANSPGYVWDFGDPGNPSDQSDLANPAYEYPAFGATYPVTLTTAPDALCQDTLVQDVFLPVRILEADFTFTATDCETDQATIVFTDASVNSLDNTVQWNWNFGALGTSTEQNPTLAINQSQSFTATLTIVTDEGCESSRAQIVSVTLIEENLADTIILCRGESIALNPDGDPDLTYLWTPANGLSDNDIANPIASPNQTILYTATITSPQFAGCSIQRQVLVWVPPVIDLTTSGDVETCDPVATVTVATDTPVNLVWTNQQGEVVSNQNSLTVDVSGVQVFSILATDPYGCQDEATVSVSGGPVDIEAVGDQILCSDEPLNVSVTNLDPNDQLIYEWSPANAIVSGINTPNPVVSNEPGETTLTVRATSQFGCIADEEVFVAVVDSDIALDFDYQVACNGATVDFFNQSANAYNYFWDFGDPNNPNDTSTAVNPTYVYSQIGTYTVTLTIGYDVECVEDAVIPIVITEPEIIADFDYDISDCSTGAVTLTFSDQSFNFLNNTDEWIWTFSNGQTSTQQNPTIVLTQDQILTATLTINTPNNCSASVSQTIPIDLTDISLAETILLCPGNNIELNPGANPNYSYLWSPAIGLDDPTSPNPTANPSVTTVYEVVVTNFTGDTCSIVQSVTVFVPEAIDLDITDDLVSCNEPVDLTAVSNVPLSYVWLNEAGQQIGNTATITVTPVVGDNTYTLLAADQYLCQASEQVTVTVPTPIQLNLTDDFVNCHEPTELEVTSNVPGLDYVWFDDQGVQVGDGPSITVDPTATTTYTVVATDALECQNEASVTVTIPVVIDLEADADLISCNEPVEISAQANVPLSFVWATINGQPVGTGQSITVDPGTTTTYVVTGTDGFFCSAQDTLEVTVPTPIDLSVTPATTACEGPVEISVSGNVNLDFTWWDEDQTDLGSTPTISVLPDETMTYYVLGTDDFQCTALDSVTVTNGIVEISTEGTVISCPVGAISILATNLDAGDDLNYQWTAGTGGEIISGSDTSNPLVAAVPGPVTFYVTASNQFGCEASDSTIVVTSFFDPVTEDSVRICSGVTTPINPNANPAYSYEWFPITGLDDPFSPNPNATVTENITYTVTITDFEGVDTCSATTFVTLLVNPLINLDALGDTTLCQLGSTDISATSSEPVDFIWAADPEFEDIIGMGPSLTVEPVGAVTYYVQATDDLGCTDTTTVLINTFPIDISTLATYDLCLNTERIIEVVNNAPDQILEYQWSPIEYIVSGGMTATPTVNPGDTTLFTVDVVNQYGCTGSASTTVLVIDVETSLFAIADPDTIIFNSGVTSQLLALENPGYVYTWTPDETLDDPTIFNPIASPDETTEYTVTVEGDAGCTSSRTVTVVVLNPDCLNPYVFVPSGFTPNGDGKNDLLYVRGDNLDVLYFAIYNRWGQLVFETSDKTVGWDGTFKGETLPPDVFGYYLRAKCYNGEDYFQKGNITLLR